MASPVTLEIVSAQLQRILDELTQVRAEQTSAREEVYALTALLLCHDEILVKLLEQLQTIAM